LSISRVDEDDFWVGDSEEFSSSPTSVTKSGVEVAGPDFFAAPGHGPLATSTILEGDDLFCEEFSSKYDLAFRYEALQNTLTPTQNDFAKTTG
jgi:hypothetical protein